MKVKSLTKTQQKTLKQYVSSTFLRYIYIPEAQSTEQSTELFDCSKYLITGQQFVFIKKPHFAQLPSKCLS